MKYSISINQKAVIDNGFKLDIIDMAIFDYMKSFMLSTKCMRILFNNREYYYIKSSKIIEDMPLLGIKTERGIRNRIEKLVECQILERCDQNQQVGKSYYCMGKNYDLLEMETKDTPRNEISNPLGKNFPTPWNEISNNYNISNYNNNDNKKEDTNVSKKEDIKILPWRDSFEEYMKLVNEARDRIYRDQELRKNLEEWHTNIDFDKTLKKAIVNYWGTEEAWKKRKRSKSKNLDMYSTLKKAMDSSMNIVYRDWRNTQRPNEATQTSSENTVLNKRDLPDGTFIEQRTDGNYRFYDSKYFKQKVSVSIDAPERPSLEHEFDTRQQKWVIPNE